MDPSSYCSLSNLASETWCQHCKVFIKEDLENKVRFWDGENIHKVKVILEIRVEQLNSASSWFGSPSLGSGMILSALDFSLSSHFFWEVNQIRNFDKTIQLTELWEYLAQ